MSVHLTETVLGQTLVLDRPARRNALTLAMWADLGALARGAGTDTGRPLNVVGAG